MGNQLLFHNSTYIQCNPNSILSLLTICLGRLDYYKLLPKANQQVVCLHCNHHVSPFVRFCFILQACLLPSGQWAGRHLSTRHTCTQLPAISSISAFISFFLSPQNNIIVVRSRTKDTRPSYDIASNQFRFSLLYVEVKRIEVKKERN